MICTHQMRILERASVPSWVLTLIQTTESYSIKKVANTTTPRGSSGSTSDENCLHNLGQPGTYMVFLPMRSISLIMHGYDIQNLRMFGMEQILIC